MDRIICVSDLVEKNGKTVGENNMKIKLHSKKCIWYKYLLPKRLTMVCSPPIYRWLFWVWST